MKYGYLLYNKPYKRNLKRSINMGDPIQSLAAYGVLKELVDEESITTVNVFDAGHYDGGPVTLLYNGVESSERTFYQADSMPLASPIKPVIISFTGEYSVSNPKLNYLRKFSPIGCRDAAMYEYLKSCDIPCYMSGCLTLTFPKRKTVPKNGKVYLTDVPDSLLPYIPEEILSGAERVTHIQSFTRDSDEKYLDRASTLRFHQESYELLYKYRDTASLVITSRLHAAAPCMAMGIPVILASNTFDTRYTFIDSFLPLYKPDKFKDIDWNPKPVDMECEKLKIKQLIKALLFDEPAGSLIEEVNRIFVRPRDMSFHLNQYRRIAQCFPFDTDDFRFCIWGITRDACRLMASINRYYPKATMLNAIDRKRTGSFEGMEILHPDQIDSLPDDVIILMPVPSAHKEAGAFLSKQHRKYILIDLKQEKFEAFHF